MEEKNQMTPTEKAQLAGIISEMLTKVTSNISDRLEILESALYFCVGRDYLLIGWGAFFDLHEKLVP